MVYHKDIYNFYKKLRKSHKKDFSKLTGIANISDIKILKNGKTTRQIRKGVNKVLSSFTSTPKAQTIKSINHLIKSHFHGKKNYSFEKDSRSKNHKLDDTSRTMAKIAKDTYNVDHKRSNIDGYNYISGLSSYDHGVYHNVKNNTIVLGARGTNVKNAKDIKADLSILAGTYSKDSRFKKYNSLYKTIKNEFPEANIVTTGHSLGGSQSSWLSHKHDLTSYNFNAGVSSFHNKNKKELSNPKANFFIKAGDLISVSALNHTIKKGILIGNPSVNPLDNHSIDNFI